MNTELNSTHDANLQSWIESANHPQTDFPPQNLPYCVMQRHGSSRLGVGIGDQILDLFELSGSGLLPAGPTPGATTSTPGRLAIAARLSSRIFCVQKVHAKR